MHQAEHECSQSTSEGTRNQITKQILSNWGHSCCDIRNSGISELVLHFFFTLIYYIVSINLLFSV